MAQEFTIKSEAIESKINQLLPTQGGFQPGIDFSASTMVIPVVDLTETAEGSGLREDLQKSLSLTSITAFRINNASNTTIINTTGYYRVFGTSRVYSNNVTNFKLTDGLTSKTFLEFEPSIGVVDYETTLFDFIVFLAAGDSLTGTATSANSVLSGSTRQIADISGNLVNPV